MNQYKTLLYKSLLFIVILIGLNYVYKFTFFESDLQTHSDIINLVRNVVKEKAEIIYLGESSNITFRENDIDKGSISDFISDYYPARKFGAITKQASHAGIYYELLQNIPPEAPVKTVVVTMNMRSFNADWIYSDLETPLQKSVVLLKDNPPLVNRFLLTFKGYDIKSKEERELQVKNKRETDTLKFPYTFPYAQVMQWDKAMAEKGIKNSDGTLNYPLTELACHYVKTYGFQIDTLTNPRIKDFDKIVALAKKRNWNLVFNLLAENVEKANELVGKDLIFLIKQNRDLLFERYNKNNVLVVNSLESVSDSEYIDRNWTTEHYAEKGRKIIAKQVAEKLKKFYPDNYVAVSYEQKITYEFFNDCEKRNTWGQMQTLTSEKSFSGEKSSKTGNKQDFSLTFEYPIKNLPDSLTKVSIEMQIFQTASDHDAKLMIDISGAKIDYMLKATPVKELVKATADWSILRYSFELPHNFNQGDIIKIYVFNPSKTAIYMDDFKIKFAR